MSYAVAAKYIKKSKAFIHKWVNRFKESKHVDDFSDRGSIGKVIKKEEKLIVTLSMLVLIRLVINTIAHCLGTCQMYLPM